MKAWVISLWIASFLIGAALGHAVFAPPVVKGITVCAYEDGNPGGMPCIWTDPDTGDRYYNDGSNYREATQ